MDSTFFYAVPELEPLVSTGPTANKLWETVTLFYNAPSQKRVKRLTLSGLMAIKISISVVL